MESLHPAVNVGGPEITVIRIPAASVGCCQTLWFSNPNKQPHGQENRLPVLLELLSGLLTRGQAGMGREQHSQVHSACRKECATG